MVCTQYNERGTRTPGVSQREGVGLSLVLSPLNGRGVNGQPLLTVIVPVFNEASTIDELLMRVLGAAPTPALSQRERGHEATKQVIVVDDGSTDGTGAKLEAWKEHVIVVTHAVNQGKGAAIRTALDSATGLFTIIQDADLEYDPNDYEALVGPLLAGEADIIYGSRYVGRFQIQGSRIQVGEWSICRCGVSLLNCLVRWLYGIRITDEATCYKVFRTDDLRAMDLKCERFEFCPEVTAKACRMGLSIHEVPISYNARSVADGKKIRWRDGWTAIRTLWRWRQWRPPQQTIDATAAHRFD